MTTASQRFTQRLLSPSNSFLTQLQISTDGANIRNSKQLIHFKGMFLSTTFSNANMGRCVRFAGENNITTNKCEVLKCDVIIYSLKFEI